MFKFFLKTLKNKNNIIPVKDIKIKQTEVIEVGEKIRGKIGKLFKGSLAIRQVDAGSDNACEQELVALSNAFYYF